MHAGLCSSVFLFREGSHKVLYTEFYPILSPGFPRSQGGYGIREAKGRFPHSRGPFIETNGLVCLFLLVPSSSLSCFTLLTLRGLPVSVTLPRSPFFSLFLFLLAFLSLTLERAFPSSPFPISSRASFFASSSSYASRESARITYLPPKDAQGST